MLQWTRGARVQRAPGGADTDGLGLRYCWVDSAEHGKREAGGLPAAIVGLHNAIHVLRSLYDVIVLL